MSLNHQSAKRELRLVALHASLFCIAFFLPIRWQMAALKRLAHYVPGRFLAIDAASTELDRVFPGRYTQGQLSESFSRHWLIDQLDFYLTLRHGKGWFRRQVDVTGVDLPPGEGPALCLTFHYGQGFWALDYLRRKGYVTAMIYLPALAPKEAPWGEKFANWLAWRRIRQFERLCGDQGIPVANSVRKIRNRLTRERSAVAIMPDVPPHEGQRVAAFSLFGQRAGMPVGGLHLAVSAKVPVVVYTMRANRQTGRSELKIHGRFGGMTSDQLVARLGEILQQELNEEPTAWHLWPWIESFYAAGQGLEEHVRPEPAEKTIRDMQ